MIDLPLLIHEKARNDRAGQLDTFGMLLAVGGRAMDEQGYKDFYEKLIAPLRDLPIEDDFDAKALAALRNRLAGG